MFTWETQKERSIRLMKISPRDKMEWLRDINEFTSSSEKIQKIRFISKLTLSSGVYLNKLRKTTVGLLKNEKIKIVLFGSRARGSHHGTSDIDIGLIPYGKIDKDKIALLKDKIEDMNIPYKIDIVNFDEVSKEFKREALKGAYVWKN